MNLNFGPIGFYLEGVSGPHSGAWNRVESLVLGLLESGESIHILGERGKHDSAETWGASSVTLVPPLGNLKRLLGKSGRVEKFARETGCRFVHVEAPPFVGCRSAFTIASVHDLRNLAGGVSRFNSLSALYLRFILPFQRAGVAAWLVLSEYGRTEVTSRLLLSKNCVFIVPPIAPQTPERIVHQIDRKTKYVLALGHLEKRKNLGVLIDALSKDSWPRNVELWIAGSDHGAQTALRELASSSNMTSIRFLGPVDDARKWQLLSDAILVAVPSTIEGFGIVALEAPVAGVPVLVSDQSALPEIAGHRDAIVAAHNSEDWAERIRRFVELPELREEILEAQQALLPKYESRSIVANLQGVYRTIISEKR